MKDLKNVPSIRFLGFNEPWEQRKLGEFVSIKSGWSPTSFEESISKDTICFIKVDDLNYSTRIQLESKLKVRVNQRYQKIKKGSIIFPKRGAAILTNKVRILGVDSYMDTNLMALEANSIYENFLYTFIERTGIYKIADTSTIPQINNKHIQPYRIKLPISLIEQKQIGTLIMQVDNLITLHQRKLIKLKNLKKGLLEKMFPQDGENVPNLRFKNFTEPWEQRKVIDICSISTGKSNTQDRIDKGSYPFYVRSPIIERSNRYLFDEEAVLTVGDGVGTGKVYHYVNGKYDLHQRVYRMFGFNKEMTAKYFYHYFSNHFNKRVMSMTAKTSVDSVRYEMISEMTIYQPLIKEQNLVSGMFDNIDNLITLHQRKLDKLENIKKSLLDKMFV
ncbi:MAG: restriction endonuclease subunit S [Sphaerochaeta sp.]